MARPIKNEGCHRLQSEVEFTDGWITDAPLQGKRILVLGAGQTKREVIALGLANKVTAIDLDVGPTGWRPGPYVQLFRQNGPVRTAKTISRKVLGIDHRLTKSLCAELGVTSHTGPRSLPNWPRFEQPMNWLTTR